MSAAPEVSVIVPTYNGGKRIYKLLNALIEQTAQIAEIIIVIDGSTDDTLLRVDKFKTTFRNLRIIEQTNAGRSGARNTGAEKATEEILVFYDDDMTPDPDSIQRHITILQNYPGYVSAGQQIEFTGCDTEFLDYKSYLTRKWVAGFGSEPLKLNAENLFLIAANMAIESDVFVELGGFDSSLRDCEDYDLAVKNYTRGFGVVFDPANKAYHRSFNSFAGYINRRREYLDGVIALHEKRKSSRFSEFYSKYNSKPGIIQKIVYWFFNGKMVKLIDRNGLRWLPKRLRFAFYDRLIAALGTYYPNKQI